MPPSLDHQLRELEAQHQAAERRRAAAHDRIRALTDIATGQGRQQFSPAETTEVDWLLGERDRAARQLEAIAPQLAEYRAAAAHDRQLQSRQSEVRPTGVQRPAYDRAARIGFEARTYRQDQDPKGKAFLLDVSRSFLFNDPAALDRLARHSREEEATRPGWSERANAGTGNYAGLVVPQYLTDMFAPVARAMRPFADCCTHHDLPEIGMTVNMPSLSTGTSAALQSAENAAGSSTTPNNTLITENVQTSTGNVTVSRQAIERGVGVDEFTMQDLVNAVATNLDSTLINQATTGLSALAANTTYTSATPTQTELWPYLFRAGSLLEKSYLQVAQWSHLVMGISRWNWLSSALSSSFPFAGTAVMSTDAHQGLVSITDEYGPAVRGRLSNGKLICVDGNIPTNLGGGTNQDEIYAVAAQECHLWEDPSGPVMIRAEQPAAASLGVLLVAYQYLAYSFRRVSSAVPQKIGGGVSTGMIVPAGF
jgi:HK97 family phage major capsid protein